MTYKKRSHGYEKILEYISWASLGISLISFTLFIMTVTSPDLIKKVVSNGSFNRVQNGIEFSALFGVALMLATNAALIGIRAEDVDSTLLRAQRSMSEASKHLGDVRNDVLKTKKIAVDSAFSVIEKILDLSRQKYTISDDKIEPHEAWLSSFRHHVDAWYEKLIKSPEKQNFSEEFALYVWLTAGKSYFTEEAYDLHRGELVTSARNYVHILTGLAVNLVQYAKTKNQKLYYYAITPANPKDWYQFPHGNVKPHFYCEEDFVAVFYRTLNAVVQNNLKRIEHRRYIICSEGKDETRKEISAKIGSDIIECQEKIIADLQTIRIALVPLNNFDFTKSFPGLDHIHTCISKTIPSISLKEKRRVYMGCERWNKKYTESKDFESVRNDCEGFAPELPNEKNESEWKEIANKGFDGLNKLWDEYKEKLNEVVLNQLDSDLKASWEKVWNLRDTWIKPVDGNFDYSSLIHDCHQLSLELQREDIREILPTAWKEKDLMHMLLYMGLTCRDLTKRWINEHTPIPLIDEFADTLHTKKKDGLFLLPIQNDPQDIVSKYWLKKQVEPEVSLFGFGPKNGNVNDINWGLAVTVSSLNYPFEVVRVKFKTDTEDLKIYGECLQKVQSAERVKPVSSLLKQ